MDQEHEVDEHRICGCGRSPTGNCIGWHALNDEELISARLQWQITEDTKRIFGIQSNRDLKFSGA